MAIRATFSESLSSKAFMVLSSGLFSVKRPASRMKKQRSVTYFHIWLIGPWLGCDCWVICFLKLQSKKKSHSAADNKEETAGHHYNYKKTNDSK